ncbi:redoxin domain-containing protein [Kangiella sp. HZ709]|uniref:redoxin domain-containing protein n=1 Tax=Kangiella sp. HZ709 TaxID=2666328 RepID=UPI0012AF7642|nr:redoxin domain-containing protein [Kangiella sp. HZ709]MRX27374.1 redoxin domain-containing protein [Kangiella sp. HZ709]
MSNLLKSLFISLASVFAFVVSILAIQQLFLGFNLTWLGTLVAAAPFALLLSWLFLIGTARTSANLMMMLEVSIIGLIVSVVGFILHDLNDYWALVLSITATLSALAYIFWYSKFNQRDCSKLAVGKQLPNVELADINGQPINTDSFKGKKTLMIFYRGNWCPLCMVQIKELASSYQKLAESGVRIALVSPQSPKHTQSLAKKFEVPFEYYIDRNNQAAKKLGIFAKNGLPFGLQIFGYESDTVMPTVVITDSNNQIHFADLTDNYRVRPEPETFTEVLAQIS